MPEYQWISDEIFTVADFFTAEECARQIALAEERGFDAAPINTPFGPQVRPKVRNNSRVMIDDRALAAELWERIRDYVPANFRQWQAVGVNERFRYYRYDVGQQFEWHYDGYFERASGERSLLTFMIYLNEGFGGGQTAFDQETIVPRTGLALCFVHRIIHKGLPVTAGRKYVLRTDVMYRPNRRDGGCD